MSAPMETSTLSPIALHWNQLSYKDVNTYTLATLPVWYVEVFQSLFRNLTVKRIRQWVGDKPLNKVVDLACGPGDWTLAYLDFAKQVVGVDINPEFIQAAKRSALSHCRGKCVEFIQDELSHYSDLKDCDLVCLGAVCQLLSDSQLEKLLENLSCNLSLRGRVYIRTTIAHRLSQPHVTKKGWYRSRESYEAIFEQLGLRIVDRFNSWSVIPSQLTQDLFGIQSFRLNRLLSAPLWSIPRIKRLLLNRSDYINWFLEKT